MKLPEFFFGAAPIGGLYSAVSDDEASATLTAAWQSGVRAFDTAPHYGVGLSERRIGDFLAGRPRQEFVVSTKVGRRLVPADGDVQGADGFYGTPALTRVRDYSRDGVRATLEDSLRRLRLDRVDIALVHDPDDHLDEAVSSALPALAKLRDEGLVGMIGAGMNSASALAWLVERADVDCVLVAGRYTLLDQSAASGLFPLCQQRGVRVLAGGVFNSGILADPDGKARFDYVPASQQVRERVANLRYGCEKYGVPVAAAALRFTLRHPAVTSVVVGARTPAEITADVGYLDVAVPDELFDELTPF
jgi:aryl-alcohol dehydrogenase-like predicted oxidoreductase